MHDLHLAQEIHQTILKYALKNNLKKVSKAVIELGQIVEHGTDISPKNLEFNLKMLAQGSVAENFEVEIIKIKGDSWKLKEIIGKN